MAVEIIWSLRARYSFDNLVVFLERKWEKKVIEKLFSELKSTLNSISKNPELFPPLILVCNEDVCLVRL